MSLKCSAEDLQKDLTGQVIIVTGGNSGIGLETVKQLAKQGATVVLACRRVEEGKKVADELNSGSKGHVEVMKLDLASLKSVDEFAAEVVAAHSTIDALVNNAGVLSPAIPTTEDGFEMTWGTNHIGTFALTHRLMPALLAAKKPRVVNISSCFHNPYPHFDSNIHLDDPNARNRKQSGLSAYGQSKAANFFHARELAARFCDQGLFAASVHPGYVQSSIGRNAFGPIGYFPRVQAAIERLTLFVSGGIYGFDGAQATLHTLLSDDALNHNGAYFSQDQSPRFEKGGFPIVSRNAQFRDDPDFGKKLWEATEKELASVGWKP